MDVEREPRCGIRTTFIGRGCQRHTNCLAWSKAIDVIAFASAGDICFSLPQNSRCTHIESTANAHNAAITCLKFVTWHQNGERFALVNLLNAPDLDYLVTSAADGNVRLWAIRRSQSAVFVKLIDDIGYASTAGRPVTCCAGAAIRRDSGEDIVVVVCAVPNGSLVAEQITVNRESTKLLIKQNYEQISFQPAFVVSVAVHIVSFEDILIISGTTDNIVDVICAKFADTSSQLRRAASLQGHTDWICSLSTRTYKNDLLVASAGQDNVIRIWRFGAYGAEEKNLVGSDIQLKNISFASTDDESVATDAKTVQIMLQAVLSAHEDWIYSVEWHPCKLQLMSASNDKTVVIWEPTELGAGMWLDKVRVGDVGGQVVGFFGANFSPDGTTILAYSYFGGFFSWQLEKGSSDDTNWKSVPTFGGHSGQIRDIAWDPTGSYLLSCSSDQTTRCYAPSCKQGVVAEIARPQLHGYDLNCVTSLSSGRFVSGADEKILRVFCVPRNFVQTLKNVSNYDCEKLFPDSIEIAERNANVPALGLSNKITDDIDVQENEVFLVGGMMNGSDATFDGSVELPTEEYLMQHTLWPEVQKLYGHGFEVFSVASDHSGAVLASACKASRPENALIIIWESEHWRRRCELRCHKLTVVQLAFSNSDSFLLSVSRDRTFAISAKSAKDPYDWKILLSSEQKYGKVHSRIIWCCAWSPDDKYFATGARDKKLCLWRFDGYDVELVAETKRSHAATAVDFVPELWDRHYILAVGFENGEIEIEKWLLGDSGEGISNTCLMRWSAHSETINRLRFRPKEGSLLSHSENVHAWELASASNDSSVKIHRLVLC